MRSRDQGKFWSIKNLDPGRGWFYSPYKSDLPLQYSVARGVPIIGLALILVNNINHLIINFGSIGYRDISLEIYRCLTGMLAHA